MFCLRTLRELKLLKFLSEAGVSENVSMSLLFCKGFSAHHQLLYELGMRMNWLALTAIQIISILDIIKPSSLEAFKEVYCEIPSFVVHDTCQF